MTRLRFGSTTVLQTERVAALVAETLTGGEVLLLHGELGASKTTFAKALAASLGVTDTVVSPTYNLVKEYEGRLKLFHLDLYRIDDQEELLELGLEETCFFPDAVTVIEWNKLSNLTGKIVEIFFEKGYSEGERVIAIEGLTI